MAVRWDVRFPRPEDSPRRFNGSFKEELDADAGPLDEDALSRRLRTLLSTFEEQVSSEAPAWPRRLGKAVLPEFYFDAFTEQLVATLEEYFHALMEQRLEAAQQRLASNTREYLREVTAMRDRLTPNARRHNVHCNEEELYVYEPLMHWPPEQQHAMRLIIEERLRHLVAGWRKPGKPSSVEVQTEGEDLVPAAAVKNKERELAKALYEIKMLEDKLRLLQARLNVGDVDLPHVDQEQERLSSELDEEHAKVTRLRKEVIRLEGLVASLETQLQVATEETKAAECKRLDREAELRSEIQRLEIEALLNDGRRSSLKSVMTPEPTGGSCEEKPKPVKQEEDKDRWRKLKADKDREAETQRRIDRTVQRRLEEMKKTMEEEMRKNIEAEVREAMETDFQRRFEEEIKTQVKKRTELEVRKKLNVVVAQALREYGVKEGDLPARDGHRSHRPSRNRIFEKLHGDAADMQERRDEARKRHHIEDEKTFLDQVEAKSRQPRGKLKLVGKRRKSREGAADPNSITMMTSGSDAVEESEEYMIIGEEEEEEEYAEDFSLTLSEIMVGKPTEWSESSVSSRRRGRTDADGPRRRSRTVSIADPESFKKTSTGASGRAGARSLSTNTLTTTGSIHKEGDEPEMEPGGGGHLSPRTEASASPGLADASPGRKQGGNLIATGGALKPMLAPAVVSNTSGMAWRTLPPAKSVDIGPAIRCVSSTGMVPSHVSKKAASPKGRRKREQKQQLIQVQLASAQLKEDAAQPLGPVTQQIRPLTAP